MPIKHPWKKLKICGLVAGELLEQSKKAFDNTISSDEFGKYTEKKKIRN